MSTAYFTIELGPNALAVDAAGNLVSIPTNYLDTTQHWYVDGQYIVNRVSGTVLDVTEKISTAGNPVIAWAKNGGTNQAWKMSGNPGTLQSQLAPGIYLNEKNGQPIIDNVPATFTFTSIETYNLTFKNNLPGDLTLKFTNAPPGQQTTFTLPSGTTTTLPFIMTSKLEVVDSTGKVLAPTPFTATKDDTYVFNPQTLAKPVLTVTDANFPNLNLSWTPPPGALPGTVTYVLKQTGPVAASFPIPAGATTFVFPNAQPNVKYTFDVVASNGALTAESDPVSITHVPSWPDSTCKKWDRVKLAEQRKRVFIDDSYATYDGILYADGISYTITGMINIVVEGVKKGKGFYTVIARGPSCTFGVFNEKVQHENVASLLPSKDAYFQTPVVRVGGIGYKTTQAVPENTYHIVVDADKREFSVYTADMKLEYTGTGLQGTTFYMFAYTTMFGSVKLV